MGFCSVVQGVGRAFSFEGKMFRDQVVGVLVLFEIRIPFEMVYDDSCTFQAFCLVSKVEHLTRLRQRALKLGPEVYEIMISKVTSTAGVVVPKNQARLGQSRITFCNKTSDASKKPIPLLHPQT